ncbi:hypothetical protein ACGFMK_29370 [Amycolatopsis sp. NPDC049252]|uniref:hypothetical protein n=1 Tax=Amycolatopsis sp. NPDC049252 TaxID=3363933 RepID=UPI00371274E1
MDVDDGEAVAELIAARLLSFGGRGFTGAVDSSTVAYRHLGGWAHARSRCSTA